MTWECCVGRTRGFGDLILSSSAVWIKIVIAVIAISVIFYMIAVIAEDPEMFYFKDGSKFVWSLLRRTGASLCGRRRTRVQLHAQDQRPMMQGTADRQDGALPDGKPERVAVYKTEAQQDRPRTEDDNPRVDRAVCHWCDGIGYIACSMCQKVCCYKKHYDQELEICMSCSRTETGKRLA